MKLQIEATVIHNDWYKFHFFMIIRTGLNRGVPIFFSFLADGIYFKKIIITAYKPLKTLPTMEIRFRATRLGEKWQSRC